MLYFVEDYYFIIKFIALVKFSSTSVLDNIILDPLIVYFLVKIPAKTMMEQGFHRNDSKSYENKLEHHLARVGDSGYH